MELTISVFPCLQSNQTNEFLDCINSLNPAKVRIPVSQKLKYIFVYGNRMRYFISLQKFQDDDTQVWAINCTQRKEQLFSRKLHSGVRNRLSPVPVEWRGLRLIELNLSVLLELTQEEKSVKLFTTCLEDRLMRLVEGKDILLVQ
ncbi:hypothetical protein AVEN_196135-1 [Araneus ventricosus]|uniref:Uncharacterized protein n=1 Tax=Araneus ventricosus TaxID=182803 RepID=A0A4Y2E372_ARAVE|nr:hypothetical protein AVEN_196135-1 [Araneus ventricosus]